MKSPIFIFTIVILTFCTIDSTVALPSKKHHTVAWYKCLGIEDNSSQAKTRDYFNEFSSTIDTVNEIQNYLREEFNVTCDHRLLMHWGFNLNDPSMHPQFRLRIEDRLDELQEKGEIKNDHDKERIKGKIFGYVKNEWIKRNRKLIDDTNYTFGLATKSNSLATIIYDIHILSDYADTNIRPLARLDFLIKQDLIKHGLTKFSKGTNQQEFAQNTTKKIIDVLRNGVKTSDLKKKHKLDVEEILQNNVNIEGLRPDQRKAVMVLIILKQDFPIIWGKSFKNRLSEQGIVITYKQSHKKTISKYLKKFF